MAGGAEGHRGAGVIYRDPGGERRRGRWAGGSHDACRQGEVGRREMRRHGDCPKKHRGLEGVHGPGEMDEGGPVGGAARLKNTFT